MSNNYRELKKRQDTSFQGGEFDSELLIFYKARIKEERYFELIRSVGNGGFFFNSSLHSSIS